MNRNHWILVGINALYLVPLFVYFLIAGKWEFLAYVGQVIALLVLLMATIRKTQFPMWLLVMLSVWAGLHMAGGSVNVNDGVLYAYQLFHIVGSGDSYVLRYDQLIHFFGFFTTTFVAYWLLLPQLKQQFRLGAVVFVAILASMGFGALNEIIEFVAVLAVPETGVGGYYNTAIDLVTNGLGALTAGLLIIKYKIGVGVFGEE
jgi:uncharacterized membrane protein YjdF